jgi:hypothetical protein
MEILLNENNEIKFELTVEGSNSKLNDIRLSIDFPKYSLGFKGLLENNVASFNIPNLSNFVQEGTHNYKMEVVIDEHYFIPIDGQVTFKKPVKVASKLVSDKQSTNGITIESKVINHVPTVNKGTEILEKEQITEKTDENLVLMTRIKGMLKR